MNSRLLAYSRLAWALFIVRAFSLSQAVGCEAKPHIIINQLNSSKSLREPIRVRNALLGRKAPTLQVKSWLAEGGQAQQHFDGKVSVVYFWDIYCGACVGLVEHNNKLCRWLMDEGGLFVSVHSAGFAPQKLKHFIKANTVEYPVALDYPGLKQKWRGRTFAAYGIHAMPYYVVIDKAGRIVSYPSQVSRGYLKQLITDEPNAARPDEPERIPIVVEPVQWNAEDAMPGSRVTCRVLIYRPDTPNLELRQLKAKSDLLEVSVKQYNDGSQRVWELLLNATAGNWGQTLADCVTFAAIYDGTEQSIDIPCRISSRSFVKCSPSTLFFGSVKPGQLVKQQVDLQLLEEAKVNKIEVKSLPRNVTVKTITAAQNSTVEVCFRSATLGVHNGTIILSVCDDQNRTQVVELPFFAFVSQPD